MEAAQAVIDEARELGRQPHRPPPQKDERVPVGFIAAGMSYAYLTHALSEMGLAGKFRSSRSG